MPASTFARDVAFQRADAEQRRGADRTRPEAGLAEQLADLVRVVVEMERAIFVGLRIEGRPALAAQRVFHDRLEMALVRELQDEHAAGSQHPRELAKDPARIDEVMRDAHADQRIEGRVREWERVRVAKDEFEARVGAKAFTAGVEQRRRRVEQDDVLVAGVLVRRDARSPPRLRSGGRPRGGSSARIAVRSQRFS